MMIPSVAGVVVPLMAVLILRFQLGLVFYDNMEWSRNRKAPQTFTALHFISRTSLPGPQSSQVFYPTERSFTLFIQKTQLDCDP